RSFLTALAATLGCGHTKQGPPNLILILTDDQRWDALGAAGNPNILTPAMDSLAAGGVRFRNAFVTTSICSPSRACCFTGRYGSLNGVSTVPGNGLNPGETTFVSPLKQAGYKTGYVGKWHLNGPKTPLEAGFDFASWCWSNNTHYNRPFFEQGEESPTTGYIEDHIANRAIEFLESAANEDAPFLLYYSTQVPHMDHEFAWKPKPETLAAYGDKQFPLPRSWHDTLDGKPPYLKTARSTMQARMYGYDDPDRVLAHTLEYSAAVTDMDRALGRMLASLDDLGLRDNTYIVFMGDNGWLLGEHRFTSKVLPYEESIRVPMIVAGPGIAPQVRDEIVLNTDIAPTLLDIAGLPALSKPNGSSLKPLIEGQTTSWRTSFYYEALSPSLGAQPLVAIRNHAWKYIQTLDRDNVAFEELYNLHKDPIEMTNLAGAGDHAAIQSDLARELTRLRQSVSLEEVV
ncbi:MAG: sulfatase-like hydrolase/transferase, partial [bacterium]|nr:sulfatase-like hydrolase/transferase [bacterium]